MVCCSVVVIDAAIAVVPFVVIDVVAAVAVAIEAAVAVAKYPLSNANEGHTMMDRL